MLFKTLGYTTSLGNIAVVSASVYNGTINDFWSPYWNFTLGSLIFLSIISISFFYLNNEKGGRNALKLYAGIYTLLSVCIYGYWAIKNLYLTLSFNEYKGLFVFFIILSLIAFLSTVSHIKEGGARFLSFISSMISLLTVGITFLMIYKYVFVQKPLEFDNLILELFTIIVGSIFFIITHLYSKKYLVGKH